MNGHLVGFSADTFLDQTVFGLDILTMLSDIEDFIEFSECNIEWKKRCELQREQLNFDKEPIDPQFASQYRDQVIESVAYRFDVSLTRQVRYAALTSIITTIEWVLISLRNRTNFKIPKKPDGKNEAIFLLEEFSQKTSFDLSLQIKKIETLISVRNCIVHASGLLASYKYHSDLRKRLPTIDGIKISNIRFLGDSIEIDRFHLQSTIEDARRWLLSLERVLRVKGLLKE